MTLPEALTLLQPPAALLHSPAQQPLFPPTSGSQPQHWVDLGCGSGLFTVALAQLLPTASTIHAIDLSPSLQPHRTPNHVNITIHKANFITDDLPSQNLDGILMANSLHYVKDKSALLKKLITYLKPHASFLFVEYDTDQPVPTWVPYPISFTKLTQLFNSAVYKNIQKLHERPSAFGHAPLYSALVHSAPPPLKKPIVKTRAKM